MNSSPIKKLLDYINFFSKILCFVGSATLCSKSEGILSHICDRGNALFMVGYMIRKMGKVKRWWRRRKKKSSKESRKQCIVVDVPIIMLYPGRLSLHFIQYGRGYARIHRCKSRLWKRREKWNWPHHDPNTASDSKLGCTLFRVGKNG